MRKLIATLTVFVLIAAAAVVSAQKAGKPKPAASASQHVMITPDQVKWGPGPPALPPGAQAAVISGDPAKPAMFVIRAKLPDGYTVPPHWHPTDEYVTVLSGTLMAGLGDKLDTGAMHALSAGAMAKMPKRTNHYVRAKGETVIQVQAIGPFDVTYVNPNDDPRRKKTTTSTRGSEKSVVASRQSRFERRVTQVSHRVSRIGARIERRLERAANRLSRIPDRLSRIPARVERAIDRLL
ncbi:MAG: cupin domain-containing protein [Vicinamibacterales bacterium]